METHWEYYVITGLVLIVLFFLYLFWHSQKQDRAIKTFLFEHLHLGWNTKIWESPYTCQVHELCTDDNFVDRSLIWWFMRRWKQSGYKNPPHFIVEVSCKRQERPPAKEYFLYAEGWQRRIIHDTEKQQLLIYASLGASQEFELQGEDVHSGLKAILLALSS